MSENNGISELYRVYRPTKFSEVIGQEAAIRVLSEKLKRNELPHALLLQGQSGTGKTTLARILKEKLGCSDTDYNEINAADSRGIDTIRDIRQRMYLAPMGGKSRIWTIDEAARLTLDAQSGLLKLLEDGPRHCYFFLCTTDPQKLLGTIRTRCTDIKLQPLSAPDLKTLLESICERSGTKHTEEVLHQIIECAEGSARKALVLLDQVKDIEDEREALEVIQKSDARKTAIDIARKLINGAKWREIAEIIAACEEEPETIRRCVLGYASAVLLKGVSERAYQVINAFEANFFDSGKAGLVRAAYEVSSAK